MSCHSNPLYSPDALTILNQVLLDEALKQAKARGYKAALIYLDDELKRYEEDLKDDPETLESYRSVVMNARNFIQEI